MLEQVILVDEDNNQIGTMPKSDVHTDKTPLHRAFSCYIFNKNGDFLISQRALSKKVWPGVWSNSVCGHPLPGEEMIAAIKRRFKDELGMTACNFDLLLPKYRYTSPAYNGIIENEICPVYIAQFVDDSCINPDETEAIRWIKWQDFIKEAESDKTGKFSWWCKDQLKQIKNNELIKRYSTCSSRNSK